MSAHPVTDLPVSRTDSVEAATLNESQADRKLDVATSDEKASAVDIEKDAGATEEDDDSRYVTGLKLVLIFA